MSPEPRRDPPAEIREVFLGATVRDLAHYRGNVCDALRKARASIFLQEEWSEGAAEVVGLSLRRLEQSDAYIGLFGYRYGSVPKGCDRSVTEQEFHRALAYWGEVGFPPVFIFLPRPDSPAAEELEGLADAVLADEFLNETDREANKRRQQTFREKVQSLWRFCRDFSTLTDLREWVISSVDHYQLEILRNTVRRAEEQAQAFRSQLSLPDLGAIDRDKQLGALRRALRALDQQANTPGMCVIIHSAEQFGQMEFLAFLKAWPGWKSSAGARVITPPYDAFEASSIVNAALSALAFVGRLAEEQPLPSAGIDALARAILEKCQDEPQVLFLSGLERLEGGLAAFHEYFWAPLYAALQNSRGHEPRPHSVSVVVAMGEALPPALPPFVWGGTFAAGQDARDLDFGMLLPLPELREFASEDIERWLERRGVEEGKLLAIAERATGADGIPGKVFERLRNEEFQGLLR